MKKILFLFLLPCLCVSAQDSINNNGFNIFHYPGGQKSSEGWLVNGNPDGYWKTYYEDGILKTEGNRKNFELDSTWKFYSDSGNLILEINYKNGKKNGIRSTYRTEITIKEDFIEDVKQGYTYYYFPDGQIQKRILFQDGREEGTAKEYAEDGTVITLIDYKRGYITNTEKINRFRNGLKHGAWRVFYPNENIKAEEFYSFGKKDGYFKEYDESGNLLTIKKFVNDIEELDAPELASYEVRTDYYKNGKVRVVQSYKDGIPEGIRREYSTEGDIVRSFVFKRGYVVGEGMTDEQGLKQGVWKEFYESGDKLAEGAYKDGKRSGEWNFFYRDGTLEQTGKYNNAGKTEGIWKWFYLSGNLRREENYIKGVADGPMKELTDSGKVIVSGRFLDGEEDGEWLYEAGDEKEMGTYVDGKREGKWRHYYKEILVFEGSFIDGNPNGIHTYWYENRKIREKGEYIAGKKEGDWSVYDEEGLKLITTTYIDGLEKRIDGNKIEWDEEKQ